MTSRGEDVAIRRADGVLRLRLNRPKSRNSISHEMMATLIDAIENALSAAKVGQAFMRLTEIVPDYQASESITDLISHERRSARG